MCNSDFSLIPFSIKICFILLHTNLLLEHENDNEVKYLIISNDMMEDILVKFKNELNRYLNYNMKGSVDLKDLINFVMILRYFKVISIIQYSSGLLKSLDILTLNITSYNQMSNSAKDAKRIEDIVLSVVPQVIPFDTRMSYFCSRLNNRNYSFSFYNQPIQIRRKNALIDTLKACINVDNNTVKFNDNIRVEFIDEYGYKEEGIDGGGLFKEYIEIINKEIFEGEYKLFVVYYNIYIRQLQIIYYIQILTHHH